MINSENLCCVLIYLFRYKHEISLVKDAKPNQEVEVVRYNREFVVIVIVITEFDCTQIPTIFCTKAILVHIKKHCKQFEVCVQA